MCNLFEIVVMKLVEIFYGNEWIKFDIKWIKYLSGSCSLDRGIG